jgi:hypothetical protein
MIQRGAAFYLLLSLSIAAAPASTVEWLDGHDLELSCDLLLEDERNPDGILCLAFVQGFIAGADTTEGIVAPDTARSHSGDETYAERAARTRLGTLRLQQMQSADLPEYCIDDATPAIVVVEKVSDYLEDHPDASDWTAHDVVREALVSSFPCER